MNRVRIQRADLLQLAAAFELQLPRPRSRLTNRILWTELQRAAWAQLDQLREARGRAAELELQLRQAHSTADDLRELLRRERVRSAS